MLLETIKKFFNDHNIGFGEKKTPEGCDVLTTSIKLEDDVPAGMLVMVYPDLVTVSITIPYVIRADKRNTVSEFLTRINGVLRRGKFAMNYDTGIVYYETEHKVYQQYEPYIDLMFAESFLLCLQMINGFFEPVMRVAEGEWSPKEALEKGVKDLETDQE